MHIRYFYCILSHASHVNSPFPHRPFYFKELLLILLKTSYVFVSDLFVKSGLSSIKENRDYPWQIGDLLPKLLAVVVDIESIEFMNLKESFNQFHFVELLLDWQIAYHDIPDEKEALFQD